MNSFFRIILFSVSLVFSILGVAQTNKLRSVTLEWDQVPDAKSYEIEIQNTATEKKFAKTIPEAKWKGQLLMGPYQYRIRSVDDRNAFGSWSDWESFTLKLPWPKPLEPSKDQKIVAKSQSAESILFRWRPVEIADKYYFEIRDEDQRVIKKLVTQETSLSLELPVGQKFTWTVASLDKSDTDLKLDTLNQNFQIRGGVLDSPEINRIQSNPDRALVWTQVKNADTYSVKLERRDSGGNWKLVKKEDKWPNVYLPMLPEFGTGDFRFSVRAMNDSFQSSKDLEYDFTRNSARAPAQELSSSDSAAPAHLRYLRDNSVTWGAGMVFSVFNCLYQDTFTSGSTQAGEVFLRDSIPIPSLESNLEVRWQTDIYSNSGVSVSTNYATAAWKHSITATGNTTVGAGLFAKETPVAASSAALQFPVIYAIRTAGPVFSLGSKGSWSSRFSWNLDLSVLLDLVKIYTPNGGGINSTYGYKIESKIYFAKVGSSPVYLGFNYFNNTVQYQNLSGDTGLVSGKPLPTGSVSYASESTGGIIIGSDYSF